MDLREAWRIIGSEIRRYIKECYREGRKPDYNFIKKYVKDRLRELRQEQ